jgi:hypothetical protein
MCMTDIGPPFFANIAQLLSSGSLPCFGCRYSNLFICLALGRDCQLPVLSVRGCQMLRDIGKLLKDRRDGAESRQIHLIVNKDTSHKRPEYSHRRLGNAKPSAWILGSTAESLPS